MWKLKFGVVCFVLTIFAPISGLMAYEVADISSEATITGRVTFQGIPPTPRIFEGEKDPKVCGQERQLTEVSVQNGSLKGAVIVLEGVTRGKPFTGQTYKGDPPGEGEFRYIGGNELSLEIRTKRCDFGPYTGVLSANEPVLFLNEDPIKHTLHTFGVRGRKGHILRTIHNLNIHPDRVVKRTFRTRKLRKSNVVKIICDRHNFMQNWFYVVQTPYFSISDEQGKFKIDQVPPGNYELIAWHPSLGLKKQNLRVEADGKVEMNFEFLYQ